MKKMRGVQGITAIVLVLTATGILGAQDSTKVAEPAAGPEKDRAASATAPVQAGEKQINILEKADLIRQISYSLGYDVFRHVNRQVDLDMAYFIQGLEDAQKGTPRLDADHMRQMLVAYQRMARQKAEQERRKTLEKNRAEGAVFLEGNKLKKGVTVLDSGLQYRILTPGKGKAPGPSDTVECHYKGRLIDGTVFDSSYSRGRPAVFQVSQVIAGWTQALKLMKTGAKWELFIPADLAYGDQGAGERIQPGHALIFEVELLGILD